MSRGSRFVAKKLKELLVPGMSRHGAGAPARLVGDDDAPGDDLLFEDDRIDPASEELPPPPSTPRPVPAPAPASTALPPVVNSLTPEEADRFQSVYDRLIKPKWND